MFVKKALFAISLFSLCSMSFATNQSTSFQGSALLSPKCTIQGTRIDFGDISPRNSGYISVVTYITTICTRETNFSISLGAGASGNILHRLLTANSALNNDKLEYSIFKDLNLSSLLGDGTNGTVTLTGVGTGTPQALPVYGYLRLNQYIRPDYYTDNLTVSVSY